MLDNAAVTGSGAIVLASQPTFPTKTAGTTDATIVLGDNLGFLGIGGTNQNVSGIIDWTEIY